MLLKTQPRVHQAKALNKSAEMHEFALMMEAGTGKSKVVIDTAANLYDQGRIDTLVVLAPNGVHRKWVEEEIPKHLAVPHAAAFYQSGAGKRASKAFEDVTWYRKGLRVLTFNLELLSLPTGLKSLVPLVTGGKTMLVVDESQRIKAPGSKRTRNAHRLGDLAAYRRILSGTPISQGLHDLYAQYRFLDWRIIGCRTFAEFKARYCVMGGYEAREILSYINVEDLMRRIAPYTFECNKRECIDLPPETWLTREVELSAEQKRHYKELRDEFITYLNDDTRLDAIQAGVRMIRLRQILSGFFPSPDGPSINLPCPRLMTCADLVEEASRGKVIIWCHFHEDVANVSSMLQERGIPSVRYYGALSPTERAKNLKAWKEDPKIVAMVATPATGGVGLDMNEADTAIIYSHDYSYENRVQLAARNMRIGQTKPVTYYDLVARGTADVRMLAVTRRKGNVAALMNGAGRQELVEILKEAA